ncbi:MAG: class I SAM-dependent methyltransferase [Phenylobacterium sp.]|uniref:class I SAM-dependent methyltransferase n=1 Tax=Phenylobacterium sp. TaxID=1871053 RepID=UPI00391C4701
MSAQAAPPADQKAHWNSTGGGAWVELQELMDRLNAPIKERVIARAFPGAGGRVLDVGCGAGDTTLDMARRLGPEGLCIGVDISEPLLERARDRAEEERLANVRFVQADAQTYRPEAPFDAIMSRFGVMFFSDFDAAFANLRQALRPGGRMAFACWRRPQDNPLALVPITAAAPFLPPLPQPDPDAPGRFAFADPDRVSGILERSGWADIRIDPLDEPTPLSLEEALAISLRMGFLGPVVAQQDAAVQASVKAAVEAALAEHVHDGVVQMSAACWLVEATA